MLQINVHNMLLKRIVMLMESADDNTKNDLNTIAYTLNNIEETNNNYQPLIYEYKF